METYLKGLFELWSQRLVERKTMPPPLACCVDERICLLQLCLVLRANLRPMMMRERYEYTQSLARGVFFPLVYGFCGKQSTI